MKHDLPARVVSELLGTLLLVAAVIGSGIMAERLSGGNVALALLANTIATGAALVALILTFGEISGAHLNPAVTLALATRRVFPWNEVGPYAAAQFSGGIAGTVVTHLMFGLHWYSLSVHVRSGAPMILSEFVATFGLVSVIWGCSKSGLRTVAVAVAAFITAAYWFTASTSFANPAVTIARCLSNTFAGIRPVDAPGFIAAQIAGALLATYLFAWFDRKREAS